MSPKFESWAKPAIRVAAAGLGVAVAGPLGGAIGGWLGLAIGGPAAELIAKYADKFGEKAAEALLDEGKDSLIERLKSEAPDLESAYRETLQLSLAAIRSADADGYADWFDDWNVCLKNTVALDLASLHPDQLAAEKLDDLLRATLVRLDGQGAAMRKPKDPPSITLQCRSMPDELFSKLKERLPELLDQSFHALIVKPEYDVAWKQAELQFRDVISNKLDVIGGQLTDVRATQLVDSGKLDEILQVVRADAEKEKRISFAEARASEAEKAAEEWKQKYLELTKANPSLQTLLSTGDLKSAAQKKTEEIQAQGANLARNYFELGTIHELRFDWPKALEAYRQAWTLDRNPEYGFKYAYSAQHQNRFKEAIAAYEEVSKLWTGSERAGVLHNLGLLYRETQRLKDADDAYSKALAIFRELAKTDPGTYLPAIASTVNDRGILYQATQRPKDAEDAYTDALSLRRQLALINSDLYKPDVAATLNNLGILYHLTERPGLSEKNFLESLSLRRDLNKKNPEIYREKVAATLNNLGNLYNDENKETDATTAFDESLQIYRELAEANPEAYLPFVAGTLSNLADVLSDSPAKLDGLTKYDESIDIYRKLLLGDTEAYLPAIASTLNNRGLLFRDIHRLVEAERDFNEALSIRRDLAKANPDANAPDAAHTLYNLARLYKSTFRRKDANDLCVEAKGLLGPYSKANPTYGNRMARILLLQGQLSESDGNAQGARELGQHALTTASDAKLIATIQQMMDRLAN